MADSDKNIRITTSKNKTTFPNIVFTGSSAGTSVLTLEVRDDNTVAFTGVDGDVFSLDYNLSTGTIWSVNDKSGTPLLRASAGGTIGIAELGSGVIVGIGQTNPKYKLDVQGWVGFASTGDGSYTVLVENGLATGNNALSIRAANALRFYNSGNTLYTGFIGAQSGVNTTYTLPPRTPTGTATSYLSSGIDGVMAWVAAPTSGGSGSVSSGTATYAAYYPATSNSVSENANLQFTGTGVSIGGRINSTSITSGSIYVYGGIGITGNAFIGGTAYIPSTTASNISNLLVSNNTATTSTTSGALVVAGGLGLAGSAFIGGTAYIPSATASNISNLLVSNNTATTSTTSGALVVAGGLGLGGNAFIGGTAYIPSATASNISNLLVSNNSATTSTTSGALVVNGGLGLGGNAFIGSTVYVPSATPSNFSNLLVSNSSATTSTTSGALVVNGGLGVGGNAFIGSTVYVPSATPSNFSNLLVSNNTATTSTTSGALVVNGGLGVGGNAFIGGTAYVPSATASNFANLLVSNNAATTSTTSGALVVNGGLGLGGNAFIGGTTYIPSATASNIANLLISSNTSSSSTSTGALVLNGGLGIVGNSNIGGTATIFSTTASVSPISGAMVVRGGVGIGLSVSVGGSLNIFNGSNYTGFIFAGSASTTYTLPPRTPTGTGTSFLSSGIDGVMAWVAAPTSGGGSPGGTNTGDIQYKSGSSFAAVTDFNFDATYNSLTVSNFPFTTPITATTAGLRLLGGTTFTGASSNGTMLAINGSASWAGNLIEAQKNGAQRLILDSAGYLTLGSSATGFTFPITNGTSGQVLTANTDGKATWTTISSSSGAGSGTVAIPGAQYQVAAYYWSATGASVSGSSTFTNNTATGVARITHTTPSSSTSTGALVVDGSVGIGGSLYVGNQINQTYSPISGAAVDHALFMQSNPVPTTVGALIQIGSANKWDGTTAGFFTGSFSGTYIGINAAAGNTSDFINFQQNGVPFFVVGAGGTSIQLGQKLDYSITNVLASFKSTVDSYNQIVVQNKSSGTQASANVVVNNDQSTDTIFYGELGINSSTFSGTGALGAPNAVYVAATSGPLVLGTTTTHPIRFTVNGGASDVMYISESGTAISVFTNLDLRAQNDIRFFNATNSNYAALQASNVTNNYTLSLPTAPVGAGASLIIVGSDSNMYFVAPGSGIAFSSATANTPIIRAKRALTLQFAAGYTPLAAGPDNVILKVPQAVDGVSLTTYQLRELDIRVETPSAGSSRIQLEKYTGTTAFTLGGGVGISMVAGFGITLTGAGIYTTSTSFASGIFTTSNDKLRLNWTLLNATHANFTVQLTMEEV